MSLQAAIKVALGSMRVDVEFGAAPGAPVAILGPNGAGKTTLLRVLAGLRPLDAGRVALDGTVLDDAAAGIFVGAERRSVGVVFQEYLLFPHLSVLDNVAFGLRSRGVAGARAQAQEWLDRVGLADVASAAPASLSGGQAQRVALARALAPEPRLLLLDEPLAALDATTRVELRRELRRHLESFPGVSILVTHDPVDAAALAEQVVVLDSGRIAQQGTLAEITARPRSRYVADLAGVNLWRGNAGGGRIALRDGATLVAATDIAGDVYAMVAPRSVALYQERPQGTPRNVWQGRVTSLEAVADRVRVQVDGELSIVAEVTPGAVAELQLARNETVWVSVKATEVDVYPV